MDCKKIGEYIQLKRKNIKLTQQELGDKLGVTDKAVSKWETGVALPDVSLYKDLCNILNISIEELLSGEDNKEIPINKKKNIVIAMLSVFVFVLSIASLYLGIFFYSNYDKVHIYDLESTNSEFDLEGKLIVIGDKNFLTINNIKYNEKERLDFDSLKYELSYIDYVLLKGNDYNDTLIFEEYLNDFNFFVTFSEDINYDKSNYFTLKIDLVDKNDELKTYHIKIKVK